MHQDIFLLYTHFQTIAGMYAGEDILPMIQIIVSLADIEVKNIYGVDFLHLVITITQRDMLGNGFRHTIEDTFQESQFTSVLHLHNDDLSFAVFSLYVYPVEFVVKGLLVAFAFQQFDDLHLFIQQHGK